MAKDGKSKAHLHLERVRAAYLAKASSPKAGNGRHPNSLANIAKGAGARTDLHLIRRKCAGTRKDGKPCNAPALTGATKCHQHGGTKQAPGHRMNLRRFADGGLQLAAQAVEASKGWKATPPETQRTVIAAAAKAPPPVWHCRKINHINLYKGAASLQAAQRGDPYPWAQWIRQQPEIQRQMDETPLPPYVQKQSIND